MKRVLLTVALCVAASASFAQKKVVNEAQSIAKGSNADFGEARTLIKGALENPETKDDAKTWYVAGFIEDQQFNAERAKQILGQQPNEPVMYEALYGILPYFQKAYELDQLPNEKGKVKPKYTKDIKSILSANHVYLFNGGAYYFDKQEYKKAYDFFNQYVEISELPMFASGIGYYEIVKQIEEHFEEEKDTLIKNLQTLTKLLFRPENMMVSYTAAREGMEGLEKLVSELKAKLFTEPVQGQPCVIHCEKKNEGFKTSSKVQYVARAGNFIDGGASYTGALQILKVILSYDYLWQNVRVKGGAYGCMSNFTTIGDGYFVSYRDPNLEKTNEIYEGVSEYLRQFSVGERDMTKYIIGTISNIDQPMTPALKGERSMNLYMNHVTAQMIEEERAQILDANEEDIRALAEVVEAVLGSNQICVIGSEEKIEEQKSLFKETKSLF